MINPMEKKYSWNLLGLNLFELSKELDNLGINHAVMATGLEPYREPGRLVLKIENEDAKVRLYAGEAHISYRDVAFPTLGPAALETFAGRYYNHGHSLRHYVGLAAGAALAMILNTLVGPVPL